MDRFLEKLNLPRLKQEEIGIKPPYDPAIPLLGIYPEETKIESWFFEKIIKIDKPLARHIKKKREKNQINKIRNEKGEIKTDNEEIQRIIETIMNNYMAIKWIN